MRHYENELKNDHGKVTGFQSACVEFAQKGLSLDERLNIGNPAIHVIEAQADAPAFDIHKGDLLVVDTSKKPRFNDLVIIGDRLLKFKTAENLQDQVVSGVVTALLKNFKE